MKIKNKIIICFLALIVLVSFLNIFSTAYMFKGLQEDRIKSSEVIFGNSLAKDIYRNVVDEDIDTITEKLFDQKGIRSEKIEYILVFDKKGTLLAHTYVLDIPAPLMSLDNTIDETQGFVITNIKEKGIPVSDITIPVMEGIKRVGTIHIGIKDKYIETVISPTKKAATQGLILALVIGLFSFVLAVAFSKTITEPLDRLQSGAERFSKEFYNVMIPVTSSDEIGSLSRSFNNMAKRLRKNYLDLKDTNEHLEQIVEKRTHALEKKKMQLQTNNKKLKELDIQKDSFISVAAHELKTPLTSIKGFAMLLQNKEISKNPNLSNHYLNLINTNTDRLYKLVCDLVDSSRINLGKITMNMEDAHPMQIFKEIRQNMEIIIKEKGIEPSFSIEKGLPKIQADTDRVIQVLRNIMINAVHFTEKGGKVMLKVYGEGGFVRFDISDTGEGIPKENQSMIFSRFYQVDSSLRRKVGGSGLGLSVSKGFIDLMGGKIWFVSEEGKGTTFSFTLRKSDNRGDNNEKKSNGRR